MITQPSLLGEGERLQRRSRRLSITVKGSLFVLGMAAGVWVGRNLIANDFSLEGTWSPTTAIAIAVTYVAGVVIGSIVLHRHIDEVERMQTYKAISVAGTAYMIVYPVWFLLWKAGFLIEPVHWLLFIGFWALLIGSAIFYRFR